MAGRWSLAFAVFWAVLLGWQLGRQAWGHVAVDAILLAAYTLRADWEMRR